MSEPTIISHGHSGYSIELERLHTTEDFTITQLVPINVIRYLAVNSVPVGLPYEISSAVIRAGLGLPIGHGSFVGTALAADMSRQLDAAIIEIELLESRLALETRTA